MSLCFCSDFYRTYHAGREATILQTGETSSARNMICSIVAPPILIFGAHLWSFWKEHNYYIFKTPELKKAELTDFRKIVRVVMSGRMERIDRQNMIMLIICVLLGIVYLVLTASLVSKLTSFVHNLQR